jgi:hypothetical protein
MPAATRDPSEPPGAPGGWDRIALQRCDAPPLRFTGREVVRAEDGDIAVCFWQVKSGGVVLLHALEAGQAADRHATAEDAMTALERYCSLLDGMGDLPADAAARQRLHLVDLLEEVARMAAWRRRFQTVAGAALDAFENWAARQAMQETRGPR